MSFTKKTRLQPRWNRFAQVTEILVEIQNRTEKIKLLDEIPAGHKFALIDMEAGTDVIKYGEPIGQSTAKIARGEHVHRHNLTSRTKQESGQ